MWGNGELPNAEAFWDRVDVRGPDECWEWRLSRNRRGYGKIGWDGRHAPAHRVAYGLATGAIPPSDTVVRHTCDNPPCCNPAHLLPGTPADNVRDMIERDRSLVGSRNPNAKLTEADVVEIRARKGERHKALAVEFGVSPAAVAHAMRGHTWRHVGQSA